MANKRSKTKKPKQQNMSGKKGGSMSAEEMGNPSPVRKQKKK